MNFGGWQRIPKERRHPILTGKVPPAYAISDDMPDPIIPEQAQEEAKNQELVIQVNSLTDMSGNVINDPNIIGFMKAAEILGKSNLILCDPNGQTMEINFPRFPKQI
jgi:hypothetical protein